jgi:tripartite ATP-independent transporter DctP family solute receptor
MNFYKLIGGTVFVFSMSAISAQAADVTINLGYAASETSAYAVLADKFEELAEEYSSGTVDVKVRCCGQLMNEDEAFKALQLGTVDMFIITDANISPHFPLMDAFVLPYIFQNKEHAYSVLEGEIGQEFVDKFHEATGVHLLTFGFVGDRDFYNSIRPISNVEDMSGIKVRVPKNRVFIETYQEFGASPIPMPWADTPTALQTGAVDGGDNGTEFIKSQKFYEYMPYISALEHFNYTTPLLASSRLMKSLNDDQRDAVIRAAKDAGLYHKETLTQGVKDVREFLTTEGKGGMSSAEIDKTGFIAAGLRVQDRYAAEQSDDFQTLIQDIREVAK